MVTKIRSVEKKTFNEKDSYTVIFEDGEKGYLAEKESDKNLKAGEDVTYVKEVKKNRKGDNYCLFTVQRNAGSSQSSQSSSAPVATTATAQSNSSLGQDIKAHKVNACTGAMHDAVGAFNSERIPWEKVTESQRELASQLCSEIDDIFSGKI